MSDLHAAATSIIDSKVWEYGHTLTEDGKLDLAQQLADDLERYADERARELVQDADDEHGAFLCARCMETHPLEDGETLAPEADGTLYCPDCVEDERSDVRDSWDL